MNHTLARHSPAQTGPMPATLALLLCACGAPSPAPGASPQSAPDPVPTQGEEVTAEPAAAPSAAPATAPAVDYAALLAQPDRSERDRGMDAGRKPAELLAFGQVAPGMRVAELAAGLGRRGLDALRVVEAIAQ